MTTAPAPARPIHAPHVANAQTLLRTLAANELVFGVVGPAGAGISEIAGALLELLQQRHFNTTILKARDHISAWSVRNGHGGLPDSPDFDQSSWLQDRGDQMRETSADNAAVARHLVIGIREARATQQGLDPNIPDPITPDGSKRAFILDSLRHPQEVVLLRQVYQDAFCLIGVVCEELQRFDRLAHKKFSEASSESVKAFMRRDENAPQPYGQRVAQAFHLSDYFIDNSVDRFIKPAGRLEENPDWDVTEQLGRLVDILTHSRIVRPRPNELGMFHAHSAGMRSSCLSRQVGAALLNGIGDVISTGTNEVPKPGGGTYGSQFPERPDTDPLFERDFRCFTHNGFCSNTRSQRTIVLDLLDQLRSVTDLAPSDEIVNRVMQTTRIGQLLEFSRAVHAEMDALLSAARQGISTMGTRLFVTTFPCHNCARHIVSAGVDEVQFIEPYLKSQAVQLHGDAITLSPTSWTPPSKASGDHEKVLFRPFVGVAPRLFRRVFQKDRALKDAQTGDIVVDFSVADGYNTQYPLRLSYAEVEAKIVQQFAEGA